MAVPPKKKPFVPFGKPKPGSPAAVAAAKKAALKKKPKAK